jgi:hypothetical protein
MTIVVVGVIISIGLSILDLSIKQIRLSTNAKDSEIAFHAAYGAAECGRYWRKASAAAMEMGGSISPTCFGVSPDGGFNEVEEVPAASISGDGRAFVYQYRFTWDVSPNQKCSQISTLVASADALGAGLVISNMTTLVPGYTLGSTKICAAGERCTVLSASGFNRPCSTALEPGISFGTIQREVLLQF